MDSGDPNGLVKRVSKSFNVQANDSLRCIFSSDSNHI